MRVSPIGPSLALLVIGLGGIPPVPALAQGRAGEAKAAAKAQGSQAFESLDALNQYYHQQSAQLERRRIDDLAALAARQKGEEADQTYAQLFHTAIASNHYDHAEKAATDLLESDRGSLQLRGQATYVLAVNLVDQKKYDDALRVIDRQLKAAAAENKTPDPERIYALGESFFQRLIRAGRHDVARRACELIIKDVNDPAIKEHFTNRLARIAMIGKPAPAIDARDVDDERVRLADYKGKVVVVYFWGDVVPALGAPQIAELNGLYSKYHKQGLEIIGVNADAAHKDVKDINKALPVVRRFLIDMRVPWANVMNGAGGRDVAKAFGVNEIPVGFVIDRDGKVAQFERVGEDLDRTVTELIGSDKNDGKK